jgi:hypothetical protein
MRSLGFAVFGRLRLLTHAIDPLETNLDTRVACRICNHHKVRCSFLDGKHKRKDEEVNSEDGEPTPKKAKVAGSKPMVVISGPSRAAGVQPTTETEELLRQLVEGVRDLTKVTQGLLGLGYRMHQQNAKLIRLGERQAYLAEQARGYGSSGLGSGMDSGVGSETEKEGTENEGSEKDKGQGKGENAEDKEETLEDDAGSGSGDKMV